MRSRGRVVRGRFPPAQVAEIKALACELPAESGRPLSRWSAAEIAEQAVARGIVCSVSGTTVWRYLAQDAIRPWAWRSWIFPRDPNFAEKAGRVLDLYERRWEGKLLHPGDYVISADEKSQLQALLGRHQPVAPGPGRPGLREFEYTRLGTMAYLAALDVHDPRRGLFGRCEAKDRHRALQPPGHAGHEHRAPRHFTSLPELDQRIMSFQHDWQQHATPIDWRYTRRDLHKLLERINHHDQLPRAT